MKIIVGFLRSPEGRAALDRAIAEAQLRDAELVVVHTARDDASEVIEYQTEVARVEERLVAAGVSFSMREYTRGNSPSEDLRQTAEENGAELLVIGLRRRSAVGKLVLGSNAQEILLKADCPVLAVKAADPDA